MKVYKIPEATVIRLSIYSRYLQQLLDEKVETVSSSEIANGVGVSPAQVRKDLAYFGEFGTRGVGYKVHELYMNLISILGLNRKWNAIIVGAGKLGSALALYQGFYGRGFHIVSVLDTDPQIIGSDLNGIKVEPLENLERRVKEDDVKIGIVTVPALSAQDVTDTLIEAGVCSILNFSPRVLKVPNGIVLRNIDLSVNLEVLSFHLAQEK